MSLDEWDKWSKLDLHAFIITMFVCGLLGFLEASLGATLITGLLLYCGLRYLQGMR